MEEKKGPRKGKRVMIWLRSGYVFFKKALVSYDLDRNDEDFLTGCINGSHPLVSQHRRSADLENK